MIDSCIKEKKFGDNGNNIGRFMWFNEIMKYQKEIIEKSKFKDNPQNEDEKIKKDLENIIKKIESKYDNGEIEFFYYILKNHKPNGVENIFSFNNKIELENSFNKNKKQFMNKIIKLYNPQRYKGDKIEERKIHYIMKEICKKLNYIYSELFEN